MVLLAFQFEGAIAIHDLGVPALIARKKSFIDTVPDIVRVLGKATRMVAKDYLFFPIISGVSAPVVLTGNLSANVIRNIWAFVVIFCGHFPDGTEVFQKEILDNETRGGWYVRQIRGTANITGTKMFHILTGNLSNQIEHHLFPDIPAVRYKALAPRVQAVCRDYDIEYNTGPLHKQFGSVVKNIFRLVKP